MIRGLNRQFTKENTRMADEQEKVLDFILRWGNLNQSYIPERGWEETLRFWRT